MGLSVTAEKPKNLKKTSRRHHSGIRRLGFADKHIKHCLYTLCSEVYRWPLPDAFGGAGGPTSPPPTT